MMLTQAFYFQLGKTVEHISYAEINFKIKRPIDNMEKAKAEAIKMLCRDNLADPDSIKHITKEEFDAKGET